MDETKTEEKTFGGAYFSLVKWWRDKTNTSFKAVDVNNINSDMSTFMNQALSTKKFHEQKQSAVQKKIPIKSMKMNKINDLEKCNQRNYSSDPKFSAPKKV